MADVDAVEEHQELSAVQRDGAAIGRSDRELEATTLQPFIKKYKSTAVPKEDFASIHSTADEYKEVAGVELGRPLLSDERGEPVMAAAKIDGLGRQVDLDAGR